MIDNITLDAALYKEFGLSFFITFGNKKILFDSGSSEKTIANARKLEVDLSIVDAAVFSHYHGDHTGGITPFLEKNAHATLYIPPEAFEHIKKVSIKRYQSDWLIINEQARFRSVEQVQEICEHVYVVKCRRWAQNTSSSFAELALVFENNGELVIFSGCSHQGIVNIVNDVIEFFPHKPIKAVIGGFHLYNLPLERIEQEVNKIVSLVSTQKIDMLCSGHCTGETASKMLQQRLGERFSTFYSGCTLEL